MWYFQWRRVFPKWKVNFWEHATEITKIAPQFSPSPSDSWQAISWATPSVPFFWILNIDLLTCEKMAAEDSSSFPFPSPHQIWQHHRLPQWVAISTKGPLERGKLNSHRWWLGPSVGPQWYGPSSSSPLLGLASPCLLYLFGDVKLIRALLPPLESKQQQ